MEALNLEKEALLFRLPYYTHQERHSDTLFEAHFFVAELSKLFSLFKTKSFLDNSLLVK
jgi:hypothetical protein